MGPVVKQEDLEIVVSQINRRFDWFTKEVKQLQREIDTLKPVPVKKKAAANG